MAIMATLAAAAAAAAVPYVIEGGRKLWSYDWDGEPNIAQDSADLGPQRAEGNRLQEMQEAGLREQIGTAEGITGAAIGASLAGQQGTGLTGLSGINMAQAQQGEVLAQKQIGGLKQDLLNLQVARHNDIMSAARDNVRDILRDHEYSTQRYQSLDALAHSTGLSDAERSYYETQRDRFA